VKLNSVGDTLWSRKYGGNGDDEFYSVLECPDGGYIAAGSTTSFGAGDEDIFHVKIDVNGNVQWCKTYGTAGQEYAYEHGIDLTNDGGYVLAGRGTSGPNPTGIFWMKVDSTGNLLWAKNFRGSAGHAVKRTLDNGYIIAGIEVSSTSSIDPILIKSDANGNVIWNKMYCGPSIDVCYAVVASNNEGYALAGRTLSFGSGGYDGFLFKTDPLGNSTCVDSTLDSVATDAPFIEATQTLFGVVSVHTVNYPFIMYRGGVVIDPCLSTALNDFPDESSILIYPNPTKNKLTISISGNLNVDNGQIELYNSVGKKVFAQEIHSLLASFNYQLNSGLYFVKFKVGEKILTEKLVVE
jgi:hypothetical protein